MIEWYVRLEDGQMEGPYSESQIKYGIESGKITEQMKIRQQQGRWASRERVQKAFDQLTEKGFFLKDQTGRTFGPFTKQRVLEFEAATNLPAHYWIRRGTKDAWTEINNTPKPKTLAAKKPAAKPITKPSPVPSGQSSVPLGIPVGAALPRPVREPSYPTREELIKEIAQIPGAESASPKPTIPPAPVMKLRGNSVVDRIIDLSERVESVFLGNPLASG